VAPVVVGTAAADRLVAWRAGAALLVALAIQVAVNYANDYFDGVRGVDTPERVGPRRVVAAGLVAPERMRTALVVALGVAGLAGLALAAATTWWLVAVGAVCGLAALGYSGGPRPYASIGLGEVMVFVFFGLVATVGSQFVQDEAVSLVSVAAAVPVGLLAVALLVANNLRDIPTDGATGKATLAVRLGDRRTRVLYVALIAAAFLVLPAVVVAAGSGWPLLAVAAAPLAIPPVGGVLSGVVGHGLVRVLGGTARLQLAYAALLAAGLVVGRLA
jgi:1,4-dihydroxy-2-naphthoate polyprenyltransferase